MEFSALMKNNRFSFHKVSRDVERFLIAAHLDSRTSCSVSLAFEEMATNVIKYSYDDSLEHFLEIRIEILENCVIMTLADDGHEFDPTACPAPDISQNLMNRPVGGLGIYLTARLSDSMNYRRENGKNILVITIGR